MEASEREPTPTITEHVTHSEYSKERTQESHIPQASFDFEDGLPVRLRTGLRTYETAASQEKQTAREFFEHTVQRDADGSIKSVSFANEDAATLFRKVAGIYRIKTIAYLAKATANELALANYDRVGGYNTGLQKISDTLQKERLIREASTGEKHSKGSDLLHMPRDTYHSLLERSRNKAAKYYPLKLSKERSGGKTVYFPEDDWYEETIQDVLTWVEGLEQAGTEVTIQKTRILTGKQPILITKVLMGKIQASEEENFMVECEVARNVVFAADVLKMGVRPNILVFDTAQFEETTPWGTYTSKLPDFIGTVATNGGNIIIMSESATRVIDNIGNDTQDSTRSFTTHNEILRNLTRRYVAHETGHFVDTEKWTATYPQKEGFARSMENGFVFENALDHLRGPRNLKYGREITPEFIYYLLSQQPEGATTPEVYGVTSTFFCWLYEKVGPDKFRIFYGNLTGSYLESKATGVKKMRRDWQTREQRRWFKGNVLHCIDGLPRDHTFTWKSSEEMVADYIKDVNRGLKPPTESVQSIVENPQLTT